MVLPVTSKWVDLSLFHPEFLRRLEGLFADPRVRGRAKICSGGRTYNQQKALYAKYKAGRGNLAANPDRRFGPKGLNGVGIWKGSWHQQQIDGWVYACDVRLSGGLKWGVFHDVAEDYGVKKTVPSENWHMQPRYTTEWFPAPALDEGYLIPPTPPVEPELPDFAAILRLIDKVGDALEIRPLRRKSRGDPVVMVQRRLADLDFKVGNPDGKYGWRTTRAVVAFQRVERLACDGCVGRKTWERMWGVED
jgi:hypothetical protein